MMENAPVQRDYFQIFANARKKLGKIIWKVLNLIKGAVRRVTP
jgi:hypothetical protein